MKSAKYDIPDIVRIESKKPDEIEYTLIGEYNLAHRTALSKEEAQMDGITFESIDGAENVATLNEEGPNDQMEAPIMPDSHEFALHSRTGAPQPHSFMGPASPEEEALQSANWQGEGPDADYQPCPGCGKMTRAALGGCPYCGTPMAGSVYVPETPPRMAGKKYTPMEQREFIDEPGVARNSDKLELEGTHYTEQELTDDLFLFGL